MVSMLSWSVEDRGLDTRSGQTKVKDYKIDKIGICCFSVKYATLISGERSRDWLAQKQDNVSERCNMSIRRLLFL